MERHVLTAWLLDLYGPLLTRRQQTLLRLHFEEDLSLAEIAHQEGISRQGAHDAIRRGEQQLHALEERLGMLKRHLAVLETLKICQNALVTGAREDQARALALVEQTLADEEGSNGL